MIPPPDKMQKTDKEAGDMGYPTQWPVSVF